MDTQDQSTSDFVSADNQVPFPSNSISDSILNIIDKRNKLADRIIPVRQHLSQLHSAIISLNKKRKSLFQAIDINDVATKIDDAKLDFVEVEIIKNLEEIERLIRRLQRPTLNIGVLGRMGQGKSTFLRSLSGIDIIPARKGGACTAVRCKFLHHDGELEATVKFHSEETFFTQVIDEYYCTLDLSPKPIDLLAFGNDPLPKASQEISTTHQEMYNRLSKDYHKNFHSYHDMVKGTLPREIKVTSASDIQKYVAQERDPTTNQLTSFDHLAVREVEVRCRFPKVDVYGLGLLDVPGLGDTKIGDEKIILETLREEVDVVLLIRKPDPDRYQWEDDFKLYELAINSLDNFSKRCFIILNHRVYGDEDNLTACHELKRNTQSIHAVGSPIIVNCSKEDEANQVLYTVLNYLNTNIVELEHTHAQICQNNLYNLHRFIHDELDKAQILLISHVGMSRQFESKFRLIIASLSEALNQMLDKLWKSCDEPDPEFKSVVEAAFKQCEDDKGIPTEDEIEKLIHLPDNKNDYRIVYLKCATELRSHLSKNFLTLDQGLQEASDKLKLEIAKTFIGRGGFGTLSDSMNSKDINFLESIRELLSIKQNKLELGFKTLLEFKLSYGALIMESIRRDLGEVFGGVRPNSQSKPSIEIGVKTGSSVIGGVASSATKVVSVVSGLPEIEPIAEVIGSVAETMASHSDMNDKTAVRSELKDLHQQAVAKCKQTLENWEKAPGRLRCYMAEEFVDRVIYDKDIEDEWRHFLGDEEIRAMVWSDFKEIQDRGKINDDWVGAVTRVREMNQLKSLTFL